MAASLEETTLLNGVAKASGESELCEADQLDVVGLRVPRKHVLAALNVQVVVDKLPSRTPRATFEVIEENE
jgi:hypothetical protein